MSSPCLSSSFLLFLLPYPLPPVLPRARPHLHLRPSPPASTSPAGPAFSPAAAGSARGRRRALGSPAPSAASSSRPTTAPPSRRPPPWPPPPVPSSAMPPPPVPFSTLAAAAAGSLLPLAGAGTLLFSWPATERRERDGAERRRETPPSSGAERTRPPDFGGRSQPPSSPNILFLGPLHPCCLHPNTPKKGPTHPGWTPSLNQTHG